MLHTAYHSKNTSNIQLSLAAIFTLRLGLRLPRRKAVFQSTTLAPKVLWQQTDKSSNNDVQKITAVILTLFAIEQRILKMRMMKWMVQMPMLPYDR